MRRAQPGLIGPAVAFDGLVAGAAVGGVLGGAYAMAIIMSGGVTPAGLLILPCSGVVIGAAVGTAIGTIVGLLAGVVLELCFWSWLGPRTAAVATTVTTLVLLVAVEVLVIGPGYWVCVLPGLAAVPMLLSVRFRAHQYSARMVAA